MDHQRVIKVHCDILLVCIMYIYYAERRRCSCWSYWHLIFFPTLISGGMGVEHIGIRGIGSIWLSPFLPKFCQAGGSFDC